MNILHYYPFVLTLDRWVGSCNTLNDLSNKAYIPNKTEDLNLSMSNMITEKTKSTFLTKDISCECRCKCDGRKCEKWNNVNCRCECEKHHICEKDYISNPAIFSCKNGKYLTNIIDNDSVVTCDDTKLYNADTETKLYDEETRTVPTKFNEKL